MLEPVSEQRDSDTKGINVVVQGTTEPTFWTPEHISGKKQRYGWNNT